MSESIASTPADDPIAAGRSALARHEWTEAFDLLSTADRASPLPGPALEALAEAAFFVARPDVTAEAKERAFRWYLDAGEEQRAAYLAVDLARGALLEGRPSIASGWVRRAERILPEEGDTYAHGYLALVRSEIAAAGGETERAITLAEQAVAIGQRATDPDLRAWSLSHLGELRIAGGATPDGLAMLEEASIAAVNGELSPFTSGVTACRMISACRDLSDYRRAHEWIEATERYCQRQSVSGFPGVCRVHRAEVTALSGAWDRAETDLQAATTELERFRAYGAQADGFYALGDIRRLRGDFDRAEEALREAHARGRSPQPALSLIRLGQGRVQAALTAIDGAIDEQGANRWGRARLLPARSEILVAAGDVVAARVAVDELATTIAEYPMPALEAGHQLALGRVQLAEGDAADAVRSLRAAVRGWREVGSPHDVARSRALLADALRARGDEDDAHLELRAAVEEFRRLGANVDAAAGERRLAEVEDRRRAPEQVHRAFMFTDIVGSTTLAEALGDAAWERLLRWHDDTLRRHIVGGEGKVVNSTGDGFFVAFASARRAVECAIAIQRALRDHGDTIGFAPPVRIGVHVAGANRRGMDYSGLGIHVAARVGALAGAGEILATGDAIAEAGLIVPDDARREVTVKGVSTPLEVAAIAWS